MANSSNIYIYILVKNNNFNIEIGGKYENYNQ